MEIKVITGQTQALVVFKVSRYTSGEAIDKVSFSSLQLLKAIWSQLLKERICSSRSKFCPLRVDSIRERLQSQGKNTGIHYVVSLCKKGWKI